MPAPSIKSIRVLLCMALVPFFANCTVVNHHAPAPKPDAPKTPEPPAERRRGIGPVLQGTMDGAGGGVVVCREDSGKIKDVRLLDLFESEDVFGEKPAPLKGSFEEEWLFFAFKFADRRRTSDDEKINYASLKTLADINKLSKLDTAKLRELSKLYEFKEDFFKRHRLVGQKMLLKRVDDSREAIWIPGCEVEQAANYQDDGTILVQKELWELLTDRGRAALIAHEYVYREYRSLGADNSRKARRIVGMIYSDREFGPTWEASDNTFFHCYYKDAPFNDFERNWFSIHIPKDDNARVMLRFSDLPDHLLIERAEYALPFNNHFVFGNSVSMKSCVNGKSAEMELKLNIPIKTSYLKETYAMDFSFKCKPQAEDGFIDLQFNIGLKNRRTKTNIEYTCGANSELLEEVHPHSPTPTPVPKS